jgi:hypothetical protein
VDYTTSLTGATEEYDGLLGQNPPGLNTARDI